jgi:predicted amidohydrolase
MKASVKASLVQFSSEWLQTERNAARMKALAETEAKAGQELIVFPELSNTGYITPVEVEEPCGFPGKTYAEFAAAYMRASETVPGPTTDALCEVARKYGVHVVVGIAQKHPVIPFTLFNSAVLIGPAGILGVHHKVHIPLNEKQYFYPGNSIETFKTELGTIGMQVCYDGRFPEITRVLALKGAEIVCSLWCVPAIFTVPDAENSLKYRSYTRAQENGLYFLSCNRTGTEGKTVMLGRSVACAPDGAAIAASTTSEEEAVRAELTEERLLRYRSKLSIFRDRRPELYGEICRPLSEPYAGAPPAPDAGAK